MKKLPGLTAIRFFAAAWVYCFHSRLWLGHTGLFARLFSVGYAGVSVFFVLSGFILSYNYLEKEYAARQFWNARAARIVPIYWLSLLVALPWTLHEAAKGKVALSADFLAVPAFLQSWIPSTTLVWNPPAWSVSTEVFFYLMFPLVAAPLAGAFRKRPVLCLIGLWILAAAPSMLYAVLRPEGPVDTESRVFWLSVIKFNPLVRLPEFLLGICVGTAFMDGWRIPRPRLATPVCLAAMGLTAAVLSGYSYPLLHNGLCAPLAALLILALASTENWLDWAPLMLLGEASYSLYLFSNPFGYMYASVAKYLTFLQSRDGIGGFIVFFLFCVAGSILVYVAFETPCRRRMRALLSPDKQALSRAA
jgi:Predicted acyltransferases